ncbi:hypothetical protein RFI_13238, partial [Reticulomyxa filosa]
VFKKKKKKKEMKELKTPNRMKKTKRKTKRKIKRKIKTKTKKETKSDDNDSGSDVRVFEELHVVAKQQLDRGSNWVEASMKEMLQKNDKSVQSWQKVVEYQYKTSVYRSKKQWRQDCIPEGLQCDMESNQLEQVSLLSKSYEYDAKFEYDYNNYISQLCIRAHSLNEPFQEAVQALFKEQIDAKKVSFFFFN